MARTASIGISIKEVEAFAEVLSLIETMKAERNRLRAKVASIREIAAEAVNDHETPEMRLAMIVRLCDFDREADGSVTTTTGTSATPRPMSGGRHTPLSMRPWLAQVGRHGEVDCGHWNCVVCTPLRGGQRD